MGSFQLKIKSCCTSELFLFPMPQSYRKKYLPNVTMYLTNSQKKGLVLGSKRNQTMSRKPPCAISKSVAQDRGTKSAALFTYTYIFISYKEFLGYSVNSGGQKQSTRNQRYLEKKAMNEDQPKVNRLHSRSPNTTLMGHSPKTTNLVSVYRFRFVIFVREKANLSERR